MNGLQHTQSPLGITLPVVRPSGPPLNTLDTNEMLVISNNPLSGENVIASLRKSRGADKLIILDAFGLDAIRMQDLLPSGQPEIVFLEISHHGTQRGHAVGPVSERPETAELRWLRDHQQEMTRLRGQWLLIAEGQLLAHSANFGEIRGAIAQNNLRSPFTYYVPTEDEAAFTLL